MADIEEAKLTEDDKVAELKNYLAVHNPKLYEAIPIIERRATERVFEELETWWAFETAYGAPVFSVRLKKYQALKSKLLGAEQKEAENATQGENTIQ